MSTLSNKEKILAAAASILVEKGPSALNIRAISKAAELSTIGIYNHFDGKQGVIDALCVNAYDLVYEAAIVACDIADTKQALIVGARNYLAMARDNEAYYRLIFGEGSRNYHATSSVVVEAADRAYSVLEALASRLLPEDASKELRQRSAVRLWALLHGFVSLHHHVIGFECFEDLDQQVTEALEMLINGTPEQPA